RFERIRTQLESGERHSDGLGHESTAVRLLIARKERRQLEGDRGRANAELAQPALTLRVRQIECMIEQRFELLPPLAVHSGHRLVPSVNGRSSLGESRPLCQTPRIPRSAKQLSLARIVAMFRSHPAAATKCCSRRRSLFTCNSHHAASARALCSHVPARRSLVKLDERSRCRLLTIWPRFGTRSR